MSDTKHKWVWQRLCSYEDTVKGKKFWSRLLRECLAFRNYKVVKDRLEKCGFEDITMQDNIPDFVPPSKFKTDNLIRNNCTTY